MNGYIKLYRKLRDWEWYGDTNCWRVFSHCLIMANWKDKTWQGELIERGSYVTSLNKFHLETGLSKQQIRTALNKLQTSGDITLRATRKYTYITVCNYDTYQGLDGVEQHTEQHTDNTRSNTQSNKEVTRGATTTEEDKNKRSNKRGRFTPPTYDEVYNHILEKEADQEYAKDEAERFINHFESVGWTRKGGGKLKSWRGAASNWIKQAKDYGRHPKNINRSYNVNEIMGH